MISAAALVPHPPLLLRELGGLQDPVADLRKAALEVVRSATAAADEAVVVGAADLSRTWDAAARVDVGRFGTTAGRPEPGEGGEPLPLSLGVGVRLLAEAGWTGPVMPVSLPWDADGDQLGTLAASLSARRGRTAVLVLGDGSARRCERAPGSFDERAFLFDDALAKALEAGDAMALAGLDPVLAAELMVLGRSAFRFLGTLALSQPSAPRASLTHREAPWGVSYLTALWSF